MVVFVSCTEPFGPTSAAQANAGPADSAIKATVVPQIVRTASAAEDARVILETRIDALDITVLEGGGEAVGRWARDNGFSLSPDAPEVLEFYASRSPIFMAARFDPGAASDLGQQVGDGTPIHLTIPTDAPWVPLRILGVGHAPSDLIEADVFVLTDAQPAMLPAPHDGMTLDHSAAATPSLLADLRSDDGMEWVPDEMWLSYLQLRIPAGSLTYDLALDASGAGAPSRVDAGFEGVPQAVADALDLARADDRWVGVLASLVIAGSGIAVLLRPRRSATRTAGA